MQQLRSLPKIVSYSIRSDQDSFNMNKATYKSILGDIRIDKWAEGIQVGVLQDACLHYVTNAVHFGTVLSVE